MIFSEIIGKGFFGIQLKEAQFILLDRHFVAASHHRYRFMANTPNKLIHNERYYEHLNAIMAIIRSGDFTDVFQHPPLIELGFTKPERWRIDYAELPECPSATDEQLYDPELFDHMCDDCRYEEDHPFDIYLSRDDLDPTLGVAPIMGAA